MAKVPLPWIPILAGLASPVLAQDYQYQYPSDPYSPTPKSQSSYSSGSSYGYDKLLTYGAIEVRYNLGDFKEDGLGNSNGIGAALRVPLFKPLYLSFGANWVTGTDDSEASYNLTSLTGGAGIFLPLVSRFHIFGEVGLRYDDAGGLLEDYNPDSLSVYLRPGLRFAATERLELAASVLFATTDNYNRNIFEINSYFALLSVLDVGLGADLSAEMNTYHAGLRLRW